MKKHTKHEGYNIDCDTCHDLHEALSQSLDYVEAAWNELANVRRWLREVLDLMDREEEAAHQREERERRKGS